MIFIIIIGVINIRIISHHLESSSTITSSSWFYPQHRHQQYVDNHNKPLWQQIREYIWHTHTPSSLYIHFVLFFSQDPYQINTTFFYFQFSKRKYYNKRGLLCVVIYHDDIKFLSDSSPIIALPCQSLSHSPALLNFKLLDFSKLLHVYLWAVAWISQNWYIHSSNLLNGFESRSHICHKYHKLYL